MRICAGNVSTTSNHCSCAGVSTRRERLRIERRDTRIRAILCASFWYKGVKKLVVERSQSLSSSKVITSGAQRTDIGLVVKKRLEERLRRDSILGRSTLTQQTEKDERDQKKKERDKKRQAKAIDNQKIKDMQKKHKDALKRVSQIKKEIKKLEEENQKLETESYVKARILANAYGKDPEVIKEYGKRLKEIPKMQRDIATQIKDFKEEKDCISR